MRRGQKAYVVRRTKAEVAASNQSSEECVKIFCIVIALVAPIACFAAEN